MKGIKFAGFAIAVSILGVWAEPAAAVVCIFLICTVYFFSES